MRRHLIAATVLLAMLIPAAPDLHACGDKYARVGASSRLKGYRPLYPASVLVFSPAGAKQDDITGFKSFLEKEGYTPTFAAHGSDVAKTIAAGKYELLVVHYDDASRVKSAAAAIPGAPSIVTILPEKSKKLEPEVRKTYEHVITPHSMSKWDALELLDHVMAARVKPSSAPDASR